MKLIPILLLFCFTGTAYGAFSESGGGSQRASVATSSAIDSQPLAFPGNVTSGCLLVVAGATFDGTPSTTITVTDSVGTSYTTLLGNDGVQTVAFVARGLAAASGANTVTVDPNDTSAFISFAIDEFCGPDATPLDTDGGQSTGTGTAVSDSLVTVAAGALVVGVMAHTTAGTPSITPDSGWTQVGENEDNSCCQSFSMIFQIVTTATTYTPSWTMGSSVNWIARSISFEPAATATRRRSNPQWIQ